MSFFNCLFGEDEKMMFNSDCKNRILLHKIKEVAGYMDVEEIDVANDLGTCLMLHQNPEKKASEFIENNEDCILCEVKKNQKSGKYVFKNLLQTSGIEITDKKRKRTTSKKKRTRK